MMGPVVLAINSPFAGGAEGQAVGLARALALVGADVKVLFLIDEGPRTAELDAFGIEWASCGYPLGGSRRLSGASSWVNAARVARRVLASWQPSVINSWLPLATVFTSSLVVGLESIPRVVSFRGSVGTQDLGRLGSTIFGRESRRAAGVVVNSPSLIGTDIDRWRGRTMDATYIPNGVTIPPIVAKPDVQPPRAITVANFRKVKGHSVLLAALAECQSEVTVELAGSGEELPRIREQIHLLGLGQRVRILPVTSDVSPHLMDAQLAIHPSLSEGMSNAVLEQLAAGLPVIATDVGATRELVTSGVEGFVVPPNDRVALAQAIDRMSADPCLRSEMGKRAREKAREFGWEACAARHLEVFERVSR